MELVGSGGVVVVVVLVVITFSARSYFGLMRSIIRFKESLVGSKRNALSTVLNADTMSPDDSCCSADTMHCSTFFTRMDSSNSRDIFFKSAFVESMPRPRFTESDAPSKFPIFCNANA